MSLIDRQSENTEARAPQATSHEAWILGYLIFGTEGSGGTTGAIMLTDFRTRPLHFGFASPVRPTHLQKLLYGQTLDEYIKVDVIAVKLLQNLPKDKRPHVIFVESKDALAVRRVTQWPMATLAKISEAGQDVSQLSLFRFDAGPSSPDHEIVSEVVTGLESITDLVNPFDRMREALKEALKEVAKKTS